MAERKLERYTVRDNRFFLYGYSLLQGFSLIFVSAAQHFQEAASQDN
jgi:hypothetical protein